ncbi:carbohydrate porin [Beijerinckia indica]|nr:carbohydrate porin [Beijerinckia indica]
MLFHEKTFVLCLVFIFAFVRTEAEAQTNEAFQLEENQEILGGSGPEVSQISTATVTLSMSTSPNDGGLDTRNSLLGDAFGLRSWLGKYGVTLSINEIDELWGNATGGIRRKAAYNGVTSMTLTADLSKSIGLEDGLFNVSGLQIHGQPFTISTHLGVLNPTSGFEASLSTRLFELWYQQAFLDHRLDVKIGQIDLDSEFIISQYASLFLNASFGWPLAPSIILYSGGPSWPLAAPGIRLRYRPDEQLTLMFAATNDNPSGHAFRNAFDPSNQTVHPAGNNFNLNTGAFLIGEVQFAVNSQDIDDPSKAGGLSSFVGGLPGIYRLGGFYDTASFLDQRYDTQGVPLASPDSNGEPMPHKGNWMLYGIMDQMLWRPSHYSPTALGLFIRATGNGGDRNVVTVGVDAGLTLKAPFEGRDNDTFGVGWGMGQISTRARGFDWDMLDASGGSYPIRGAEHRLEITYQAQVAPWLIVQPDIQYVWNPGGGVPNPLTGAKIGDELIFGIHTSVAF